MDLAARRLAALFVLGLVALYSPLLGAANRPGSIFGVPTLPLYLFLVWGALVFASWLVSRGDKNRE